MTKFDIINKTEEHHAGAGVTADAITSADMDMLDLQNVVSERQEAMQLTTQMMQSLNDAEKSIVDNIGGGDGHGSSGDSSASSDGDHPPGWPFTSTVSDVNHAGAGVAAAHGAETASLPDHVVTVTLPDQAAPDLNGFLNGNGDFGNGSFGNGDFGNGNFGNGDFGSGNFGNGSFGNGDFGNGSFGNGSFGNGSFGNGSFGNGDFGNGSFGNGDFGNGDLGNLGISGLGVPGSSELGHLGPDDFQNPMTQDFDGYSGRVGSPKQEFGNAKYDLSHGDVGGAVERTGEGIVSAGVNMVRQGDDHGDKTEEGLGVATMSVGAVVYSEGAVISGVQAAGDVVVKAAEGVAKKAYDGIVSFFSSDDDKEKGKDQSKPDHPDPEHGGGNQPVDDSGTGTAHPTTHNSEQPVDDSGTGPVHPLTGATAQPVDDSGAGPAHPGTHLGAVAVDTPSAGSANLATASFGGHSAAFWDAAAHSVADSQHATAATTANAPIADASAPVAHNDSLGIFEHSAATSFAASAPVADSHANMDALATTHIASVHVETEPSHSLGAGLDLSHLALHM